MSPWQIILCAWILGAPLLAVLVGKMIAFGARPPASVALEPTFLVRRPVTQSESALAG